MPPVSKYLNLTLHKVKHQLRGSCPTCQNDDIRILAITPAKNGGVFFCHHPQIGGSCIDLVAHILAFPLPEAGQWLEDTLPSTVSAQPQRPQPQPQQTEPSKGFDPDEFGAKLAYGEQVEALGLSEEAAKLHRVGIHRAKLYIPVCPPDVTPVGFVEFDGAKLKLPDKWLRPSKVVKLKRPA